MQVGNEHFLNKIHKNIGSRLLSIQNVTSEDEGDYVCEVTVHSGEKNNNTFTLKAFSMCYDYYF